MKGITFILFCLTSAIIFLSVDFFHAIIIYSDFHAQLRNIIRQIYY